MQVAWSFDKESPEMITRVLTRDPFHGIQGRPGVARRVKRVFNRADISNNQVSMQDADLTRAGDSQSAGVRRRI